MEHFAQATMEAFASYEKAKRVSQPEEPEALAGQAWAGGALFCAVQRLMNASAEFERFYCPPNTRPRVTEERAQAFTTTLMALVDTLQGDELLYKLRVEIAGLKFRMRYFDGLEPDTPFAIPPAGGWG